jgi:uncharacterized protein (DUF2384 family)
MKPTKSATMGPTHRLLATALQNEIDRLYAAKGKLLSIDPEIADQAIKTFESVDGAAIWLTSPAHGLHGRVPVDLTATAKGREKVSKLLSRIEHGVL